MDQHVLPRRDLVCHTDEEDCVCGPQTVRVEATDGSTMGWIYVHYALDNRK